MGFFLGVQILTGLFLRFHYCSNYELAFYSVRHIMRDVDLGWLVRIIHANGARFFFIRMYFHIARGIYYRRYRFSFYTWIIGVSIALVTMATAFLGYVLPWGQISFWGATVITNLFSAIPFLGRDIVVWLWGGFAVGGPTLSRFLGLHFILPIIISLIVIVHLFFLHQNGSSNPLGVRRNQDKIYFHSYFSLKDIVGFLLIFFFFREIIFLFPWTLGDTENFIIANPLLTPIHIQPEWYFLFAYAILRSIPNKLGGVIALVISVLILYFLFLKSYGFKISCSFSPIQKIFWWGFLGVIFLLTWIGARPVEEPYLVLGQGFTFLYFIRYFLIII